jgi:hypothetical protein
MSAPHELAPNLCWLLGHVKTPAHGLGGEDWRDRSLKRPRPPYRLDCRHCADCGKDSGKEEVAHCKRETTAKSSESSKREQLLQSRVHFGKFISPTR